MTYSFIVIDKKNKLNLQAFNNFLSKTYLKGYEVLYCSTKKRNCPENINNIVFDNQSDPEQIINRVTKKCKMQNICIIRDIKDYKQVQLLTSKLTNASQIVYFKKQKKGIKAFFDKAITKIINFVFYQNIMPINFNACVYGENASKILKTIDKPSFLTRNNLWEGVEYVFVDGGNNYNFAYKKLGYVLKTLIPAILSVALIIIKIFVKFKAYTCIHMIYYTIIFICLVISVVYMLKWQLAKKIGDA